MTIHASVVSEQPLPKTLSRVQRFPPGEREVPSGPIPPPAPDAWVRILRRSPIIRCCTRCGGHVTCVDANHSLAELDCIDCGELVWEPSVDVFRQLVARINALQSKNRG